MMSRKVVIDNELVPAWQRELTQLANGRQTPSPAQDTAASKANNGRSALEPLNVVDAHTFLGMDLPPRELMLSPWLLCQSVNMIYARRGTGKTFLALAIAYAIAAGAAVAGWIANKARKVLYLDGEMLAVSMQERLAAIAMGSDREPQPGMLNIVTPDLQNGFMPDLATLGGQAALQAAIPEDTEVIIVDSLSSLVRGEGRENDADSWLPVAQWALAQRVARRSVIFLHHANKRGEQRGTSKREDILDTVIALRSPADYSPNGPAKFEIHVEKSRALCGDFQPIEAELQAVEGGGVLWAYKPLEQTIEARVRELVDAGMPKREIAEELHINRTTVYRILARQKTAGE